MQIPAQSDKFTPLQLELQRLFSQDVPEEQLIQLKRLIASYFAGKLSDQIEYMFSNDDEVDSWVDSLKDSHSPTKYQPDAGNSFRDNR